MATGRRCVSPDGCGGGPAVVTLVFCGLMLAALSWDVATRRIPNVLVFMTLGAGLALRAGAGWPALAAGLLGAGLALLITVPLFALRAVGGGDVKLLGAVGAFMGPMGFLFALVATALVGGVLGLGSAIRRGVLLPVLLDTKDLAVHGLTLGKAGARSTLDTPGAITIPYGAAIAIGSVAAWLLLGGTATW